MKMKVYGPRFIVKAPVTDDKTKGGLYLPTEDQRDLSPVRCTVESAGDDSPTIKIGDIVMVNKHALNLPDRCLDKDARLYLVNEADIYCTLHYEDETTTGPIVETEKTKGEKK